MGNCMNLLKRVAFPWKVLLSSFHGLSCSFGWDCLHLSPTHRPWSSPLLHPTPHTLLLEWITPKPIWFKSIPSFLIGYRLKYRHEVEYILRAFTATNLQRFSEKHTYPHNFTSLKSVCVLTSRAAMWWEWYTCCCLWTHNRICKRDAGRVEEAPEIIAEHSVKNTSFSDLLGARRTILYRMHPWPGMLKVAGLEAFSNQLLLLFHCLSYFCRRITWCPNLRELHQ